MKNVFAKMNEDARKAISIAFVHHKGGTGKTTSCLNIAGWLTRMNKAVLVIDLDPQGSATTGLGIDRTTCQSTIYNVLLRQEELDEIILETESGVYLAPSSLDLLDAEIHMAGQGNNAGILKRKLSQIGEYFDYILIDVPPGSTLLMKNGIVAAENMILPLDSGVFAYETIETIKTLLIDLNNELGIEINIMMFIVREFGPAFFYLKPTLQIKKLVREVLINNNMPQVKIFRIPFSEKIYKAQVKGLPISHYAPHSRAGRAYKIIAKEIMNYY